MKVVKIIALVLVALFVLGLGGTYVYFAHIRAPQGELVVLASDQPVSFSIDGGPPIEVPARGRHKVWLAAGGHRLEVTAPEALVREFELTERKTTVVPVLAEQCFVTLDVTQSHYDVGGGKQYAPQLVDTQRTSSAFEPAYGARTSIDDIPEKRISGVTVRVLATKPCD